LEVVRRGEGREEREFSRPKSRGFFGGAISTEGRVLMIIRS
jgi:hypothetical protein